MLVTHEREKLINAVIFFANNTRYLGITKLCKLLYFLDFEHFKETGRSVTGQDYFAWKKGPVPRDLYEEVKVPQADMADKVQFSHRRVWQEKEMLVVTPLVDFDSTHFSKRELRILQSLASEYAGTQADDMVEATHLENQPWHKIYVEMGLRQEQIPYELALRRQEEGEMRKVVKEREALVHHLREA